MIGEAPGPAKPPMQQPPVAQASALLAQHRVIAAHAHVVPKPFKTFAVRSEEARHADVARAPYGSVHLIRTGFLGPAVLSGLCALGRSRMRVISVFSDIDYSAVTLAELVSAAAPQVLDLVDHIATALQATGVLGHDLVPYQASVAARIDYLAACGAGFHNDVRGHWTRCLFWNLALEVANDVEFVMPHAGVRLAMQPGDLIVFDPTMAHGLCRSHDHGQAVAASFDPGNPQQNNPHQIFLSGELPLTDTHWAGLGSPWLPVEMHAQQAALELMAAEFDERSGHIKRLRSLADCMLRNMRYADAESAESAGSAQPRASPLE